MNGMHHATSQFVSPRRRSMSVFPMPIIVLLLKSRTLTLLWLLLPPGSNKDFTIKSVMRRNSDVRDKKWSSVAGVVIIDEMTTSILSESLGERPTCKGASSDTHDQLGARYSMCCGFLVVCKTSQRT